MKREAVSRRKASHFGKVKLAFKSPGLRAKRMLRQGVDLQIRATARRWRLIIKVGWTRLAGGLKVNMQHSYVVALADVPCVSVCPTMQCSGIPRANGITRCVLGESRHGVSRRGRPLPEARPLID